MRKLTFAFLLLFAASAFSAGRELGPRGAAPTSYPTANPHIAFAGERFLTVWTENMGSVGVHLMGAFSDARGARVSAIAFPVMESFSGHPLQLVGTGDSYALFWRDAFDNTLLTDIGLDGRVIRTTALLIPRNFFVHAGWNGTRFFAVVRHIAGSIYRSEGFLLERSGEIVHRGELFDDRVYDFHVIGDGDGFVAAAAGFDGTFAYRITADGEMSESVVDGTSSFRALISKTVGGELLVVYTAALELRAALVDASGDLVTRGVLATSTVPMSLAHLRRTGGDHLVTYIALGEEESGLATLILHEDGTVTPRPELAAQLPPRQAAHVLAASNELTTLAVYARAGVYPAPLTTVATANDATAREPEIISVARSRQSQPILASALGYVLAAWSDIQGTAAFVRTSWLEPDATPLADRIAAPAYVAGRELAWNGSEYLAIAVRGDRLLATRLTIDGEPLGHPIVLGGVFRPWWIVDATAVWAGDRWMIAWDGGNGIFLSTIRDGVAAPPKAFAAEEYARTEPALGFNGSTLLLVWNEADAPPCYFPPCMSGETKAWAARLTLDGELASARLPIPVAHDYTLATSGSEFFILGGTTATTIDVSGTPRTIASREIFNWPATSDVTWDGSSYAVALRYHGAVWHLSATHFDRDLNVVGTPRGTTTLPPDDFVAPSIAGGLVGVQEGDPVNGARAVVYRESELSALPAPPPAPLNVRATPTGDGRYEITWDEAPGAELYQVTIFGGGIIQEIHQVPATAPRRVVTRYPGARVIAMNAGGASDPLPRRRAVRR